MRETSKLSVGQKQRLGYYTIAVEIVVQGEPGTICMTLPELEKYYTNLGAFMHAKQAQFGIANVSRHVDYQTGRNVITIRR